MHSAQHEAVSRLLSESAAMAADYIRKVLLQYTDEALKQQLETIERQDPHRAAILLELIQSHSKGLGHY